MGGAIYRITGTDSVRGAVRAFFVSAESEAMARDFASRRGVVISEVARVSETDVPEDVPVLLAHERRPQANEWLPWLDFSFLPPSAYLIAGVVGVAFGVSRWQWWGGGWVAVVAAGLALIVLGCIRFATYQRNDE